MKITYRCNKKMPFSNSTNQPDFRGKNIHFGSGILGKNFWYMLQLFNNIKKVFVSRNT